jgi:hypothetical protein
MKSLSTTLAGIGLLLITADRLPAPISEEKPSPTPEMEKLRTAPAKHKSVESSDSNSARRFDGTWQANGVSNAGEISTRWVAMIIVKDGKKAQWTRESTFTLAPGKTWPGLWSLPAPYNTVSPIFNKWADESTDLKTEGPNLTVRWPADWLADWGPKSIPRQFFERWKGSENTVTYILNGNQLVSTDRKSTAVWQRIR